MAGYLEEEVLLGICDGTEVPGADAVQGEIVAASCSVSGAIYKPFSVFGDNTFWDARVFCAGDNIFDGVMFVDDCVYALGCDSHGKE